MLFIHLSDDPAETTVEFCLPDVTVTHGEQSVVIESECFDPTNGEEPYPTHDGARRTR